MASKLQSMRNKYQANVDQSMGSTRLQAKAGKPDAPAATTTTTTTVPSIARHAGLGRLADAAVIPLARLSPDPDQPRQEFDAEAIDRLAVSLKEYGQLMPIRVRYAEDIDRYIIVCGERRYRAARRAGLLNLAAIVYDRPLSAEEILTVQLIENCCREDLSPLDQAKAIRALIERRGLTQAQVGKELGVTQGTVSKSLALLELPPPVQARVIAGELSPSVARELLRVEDPKQLESGVEMAVHYRWNQSQASTWARARGAVIDVEFEDAPASDYSARNNPGPSEERACRICGCTDADCSQCIDKTGEPCSWVGQNLCSRCADEMEEAEDAPAQDLNRIYSARNNPGENGEVGTVAPSGNYSARNNPDPVIGPPTAKFLVRNAKGASLYCLTAPSLDVAETWARNNHPADWGGSVGPITEAEWADLPSWITTRPASGPPSPIHGNAETPGVPALIAPTKVIPPPSESTGRKPEQLVFGFVSDSGIEIVANWAPGKSRDEILQAVWEFKVRMERKYLL